MIEQPSDQFPTGRLPAPGDVMLRLTGEITTKGRRTRSRFQKQLADNVRDSLESSGASCRIRSDWSRLYVRADVPVEDPLSRVFGISSFSVVEAECRADLDEIVKVGRATFTDRVRGKRFAVRARRAGRHSFNSQDVKRELGTAFDRSRGRGMRGGSGRPGTLLFRPAGRIGRATARGRGKGRLSPFRRIRFCGGRLDDAASWRGAGLRVL